MRRSCLSSPILADSVEASSERGVRDRNTLSSQVGLKETSESEESEVCSPVPNLLCRRACKRVQTILWVKVHV